MKTLTIILCCFTSMCNLFAQEDTKESSYGISISPVPISKAYTLGIGFYYARDFSKTGEGFGAIINTSYLVPDKIYSDVLNYGYEVELALKYDFPVQKNIEIYPSIGGGGFSNIFMDGESDSKLYFIVGGGATLSLSKMIKLGVDIFNPFLDGANVAIVSNFRFNF